MITKSFSLLFKLKKPKNYVAGPQPIHLRITVNGQRTEYSVQRSCEPSRWNAAQGRSSGTKEEARILNAYLDGLQRRVYEAQQELMDAREEVTATAIKNKLLGVTEKPRLLLEIFQQHNDQIKSLIGNGYAKNTHTRYETALEHTRSFLNWKFNIQDMDIAKMNYAFLADFDFYLRSIKKCGHNTTIKYLTNFKKIILQCVKKEWLQRDPFTGFSLATKKVVKPFLTQNELDLLASKTFATPRLTITRDVFLFSCYTGLAYVDVHKLKRKEISIGIDGDKWIFIQRQKSDEPSRIPLLPICLEILDRYKDHPQSVNEDRALPIWSNQKMNEYLKEIADLCGITKVLTYHVARHTFATTVTLGNGVPIETVAKMLGHATLRMTQHYAKILDNKISDDMKLIKEKYGAKDNGPALAPVRLAKAN